MGDSDNKTERMKALKNGKGIQYLLDEAYRILGNPIVTYDMEYKVIACTENAVTDDPIWNESVTTGMVSYDRLEFCKDECFFKRAPVREKIIFLTHDELKYDRLFTRLFTTNNMQVGYLCMVACYKPFDAEDPELFEAVCGIFNEELSASEFYQNYGQTHMETLVSKLIENNIEDIDLISSMDSIYIGLKDILRLAVVDISQCDPGHTKLAYFRDIFKQIRPDFKYVIYSNYIVCLFSSGHTVLDIEPIIKLYNIFEQNNLYAGISGYFENIFELPKYYNQAVNALSNGLKHNNDQRIFPYGEI